MKKITIYDPAMCCSTGVCGTDIDPKLVEFANALNVLKVNSIVVERYNLAQEPAAFVENAEVQTYLQTEGADKLPLIFIDDTEKFKGKYPSTEELLALANIENPLKEESCGCGSGGCC